jgi:hypothetical protein
VALNETTMHDRIGLKVEKLDAGFRSNAAAPVALASMLCSRHASGADSGLAGVPALWRYPHRKPCGTDARSALRAPDAASIKQFDGEGLKAGAHRNGVTGPTAQWRPDLFCRLPDRCRRQQPGIGSRGGAKASRTTASWFGWSSGAS